MRLIRAYICHISIITGSGIKVFKRIIRDIIGEYGSRSKGSLIWPSIRRFIVIP
jgi:hypothetical protein